MRAAYSILILLLCGALRAPAHEIPKDVSVQIFVKPSGSKLQLLARMPLASVRDIEFPEQGGYLDVEKLTPQLSGLARLWLADFIELREDDARLPRPTVVATQVSISSDRSFAAFDTALARVTGSKPTNADRLVFNQVTLDTLLEYPIRSDRSRFSIRPGVEGLGERVLAVVRYVTPDGAVRAYEFSGDPGLVPLDPRWHQAAFRFVHLGFLHILDGTDHLLFLGCLVIPLRRVRPLLVVVTAFTIAHSVTLVSSAYGLAPEALWFPPLVETLIAVSIVWLALENIVGVTGARRWAAAFGFGLIHGFGFSFALRETLQFAGSHLITSLLSFNLGVELGQLAVLLVLVPALDLLFRYVVAERVGTIILSAIVAHTAWHWMLERYADLRRFPLPTLDSSWIALATRWLLILLVAGAAAAGAARLLRRGDRARVI